MRTRITIRYHDVYIFAGWLLHSSGNNNNMLECCLFEKKKNYFLLGVITLKYVRCITR